MDEKPLLTIVIPTYNHAHFLREALQSVCAQSFSNWETIVVNNYSDDDTVAVIASFDDARIRLENFRNNGVIASSRNRGINLARGDYIAFLDSDDIWYPEKLAKCLAFFDSDTDLVAHGLRWIGGEQREMQCGPARRATFDALFDKGNCITPSATVVRKALLDQLGGFSENPAVVTSEDYHLWLKLAKGGAKMKFLEDILGDYRIHSGNQSGSVIRHLQSVLHVIDEYSPMVSTGSMGVRMRIRRRVGLAYYSAARAMQKGKCYREAAALFFRALRQWPFEPRVYAAGMLNVLGIIKTLGPRRA